MSNQSDTRGDIPEKRAGDQLVAFAVLVGLILWVIVLPWVEPFSLLGVAIPATGYLLALVALAFRRALEVCHDE